MDNISKSLSTDKNLFWSIVLFWTINYRFKDKDKFFKIQHFLTAKNLKRADIYLALFFLEQLLNFYDVGTIFKIANSLLAFPFSHWHKTISLSSLFFCWTIHYISRLKLCHVFIQCKKCKMKSKIHLVLLIISKYRCIWFEY